MDITTNFESALDPNIILGGSYFLDSANALVGEKSLRMVTSKTEAPYYFYYWHTGIPIPDTSIRLEATLAINPGIHSVGIGWKFIIGGNLSIMFCRVNYGNNKIELVEGTPSPHVWQTVASPIPTELRYNNPIRPFRMSLDINPLTFQYKRFRLHDFTSRARGGNNWVWDLSTVNRTDVSTDADGMLIKINPQGTSTVAGVAWIDEIRAYSI